MSDLVSFVRDLGFPIFVAVFVLVRMEPTLNRLDKTIAKLLEHLKVND